MYADLQLARQIVRNHIAKGWAKMRYEQMVQDSDPSTGRMLAELLGVPCPHSRMAEAAFYAAWHLRRAYPERDTPKVSLAWTERVSQPEEIDRILQIVRQQLMETVLHRTQPTELPEENTPKKLSKGGYIEWVPFRCRHAVPDSKGIYLLAHFEVPSSGVDPLAEEVIDIGRTTDGTIKRRLEGFKKVVRTGWGQKSSGWTYLAEYATSFDQVINFKGLYVSWRETPGWTNSDIKSLEDWLLKEYCRVHNRRPKINKQPIEGVGGNI